MKEKKDNIKNYSYKHIACGKCNNVSKSIFEDFQNRVRENQLIYCIHCQASFYPVNKFGSYNFEWVNDEK